MHVVDGAVADGCLSECSPHSQLGSLFLASLMMSFFPRLGLLGALDHVLALDVLVVHAGVFGGWIHLCVRLVHRLLAQQVCLEHVGVAHRLLDGALLVSLHILILVGVRPSLMVLVAGVLGSLVRLGLDHAL